jgi:hypothetical protein
VHALKMLQVLDTSHEERFDRVTRMAKRMFGVSFSLDAPASLCKMSSTFLKACSNIFVPKIYGVNGGGLCLN